MMSSSNSDLQALKNEIKIIHARMDLAKKKDLGLWQMLCEEARGLAEAIFNLELEAA